MKLRRPQETIAARTLAFLTDVHAQICIQGDNEPRMIFAAMRHHLTAPCFVGAAVRLGILRRYGWRWAWEINAEPSPRLAAVLLEEVRRQRKEGGFRTSRSYKMKLKSAA